MSVLTLMSWLKYTTLTMCDMRKASDVMSLSDPALFCHEAITRRNK